MDLTGLPVDGEGVLVEAFGRLGLGGVVLQDGGDHADRRRYAVRATAAGRQTLARASELAGQVDDAVFAGLNNLEREQLLALLLRVAQSDPDLDRLIRSGAMTEPPDSRADPR